MHANKIAAEQHQHPRHAQHVGAGGKVLCRDMLSKVCHGQPTAPERATRVRAAAGVEGSVIKLATGLYCN